ncbi:metallophosphoesterase family protein [Actinokineospora soli]|uniref:Metallophosphoesterase family protein n=1 Tax=Actinokineospora soli TaxID=1048753 RepID=A0ABW2TIE3_9PSEU
MTAALGAALLIGGVAVAAGPAAGGVAAQPAALAEPAAQIPQLAERGATTGRAGVSGGAHSLHNGQKVCADGAKWMRLRFTELSLRGADTVTLTGSAGGRYTLTGRNWPGKAFHTRAFEGDCVTVDASISDAASKFTIDAYQSGTQDLAAESVTVAAVGDVCGSSCNQTAPVVKNMNPTALILAGDNAYSNGTLSEYRNLYDPYYGQFKAITYPSPGNHEYGTSGAAGYFDYFGARAGERGKGYYSFDVGDWHFVALNSNITRTATSAQVAWLKNDLAANTKPCTAAFWHHPRFSRGSHGDDTSVTPFFQALYDARADLVVVGHDHNYQRFAPSKPTGARDDLNGVRQLLIGTGGRGFYSFDSTPAAVVEASNANTFGVGKLTLTSTGYRHDFVPVAGRTYTDTVSGTCHKADKDFSLAANPASIGVKVGNSASTTVGVTSHNGFTGQAALSVSGLPAGVQASFSPNPVTLTANQTASSTLTFTAADTATAGTTEVTVTATVGTVSRTTKVALTVSSGVGGGFTDDFEVNRGWVVNPSGTDTATSGQFAIGDPEQTVSSYNGQVKQLGTTTSGVNCLVTGRLAGSIEGAYDVDGGVTSARSPLITVPSGAPRLTFAFSYAQGNNTTSADYLRVKVVSGGTTTTVFERLGAASERAGQWENASVDLSAYAGRDVHLLVEAADLGTASFWEAQVDDVAVVG